MVRCVALCLVALLAYGMIVGCDPFEHRATRVVETRFDSPKGPGIEVAYVCPCGRAPFKEVDWL